MLTLALSSHEIVVVVSPDPASITAAYALIKHICGIIRISSIFTYWSTRLVPKLKHR